MVALPPTAMPKPVPAFTLSSLASPALLPRMVVGAVVLITINTLIFGFVNWIPTFFVQQGLSITRSFSYALVIALGSPFGCALGAFAADRLGRRPTIIGASASLAVSDIPWDGPLGALRIGRVKGALIANPTHVQMAESDMDIIYVGNATEVVMFEGAAKEISEAEFVAAMKFGQDCCQPLIQAQKELAARGGKKKRSITVSIVPDDILAEAKQLAGGRMVPALLTHKKLDREAAVKAVTDDVGAKLVAKFGAEKVTEHVLREAFYYIQKEAVRGLIMQENKRLDGRGFDEIRPITCEVGILPRAHGSALFSRGEMARRPNGFSDGC